LIHALWPVHELAGLAFVDGEFQEYDMHGSDGVV
jgi:hypothetical protein